MFQQIGHNVSLDVMHAHEGLIRRRADRLGKRRAHQKRTGKARACRNADLVDVIQSYPRFFQRMLEDEGDVV